MNISEPFIRRPIGTSLLALGLLLLGVVARLGLPVAPLPNLELPIIFVNTNQPGASPETMAATVATPLERHFGQIAGLNEMTSTSALSSSVVIMQFDMDKGVDSAARDVSAAINAANADLPTGLPTPPTYRKANPNNAPILILALTSESRPLSDLYNYADSLIAQRISQVPGVSQVEIVGGAQPAVHIQVDQAHLASMGMAMDDVRNALSAMTANAPKGMLSGDGQNLMITADDQLAKADDYRKLIIGQNKGVPVPLSAVAKVFDGSLNPYQAGWYNKQRSVLMLIRKQSDANVIKTVEGIRELLPLIRSWLPPAVALQIQTDRTQTIRASVDDVQFSLVLSVALVVMVMLVFLRRGVPTAIAGITVPLSIAGTFAVMWLLDFSLDNFSLMALTISVGFVVDDAIVVIENIMRYVERGESPFQAALRGGREIGFTVLSMSLSLIAVFIPILFMSGIVGKLFNEFAVTLAAAIAVSGVVSLTLTPSLCGQFLRAEHAHEGGVIAKPKGAYERFLNQCERFFDWMLRGYRHTLDWSFTRPGLMIVLTIGSLVLTVLLYKFVPKGLFPQQDTGLLQVQIQASEDISFQSLVAKQQAVADIILTDPDVDSIASFVGGRNSSNNGSLFVSMKPLGRERHADVDTIINRLRPKVSVIPDLSVYMQPVSDLRAGSAPGKAQNSYTVSSLTLPPLYEWVPKIVDALKQRPEMKDVNSDLEQAGLQISVVVDRDAASRLNIRTLDVDKALSDAFGQAQILTTFTQLNQYRVILESSAEDQRDPDALRHVYVKSGSGGTVPLSSIAHFEQSTAPLEVHHLGEFPVVNISYNLAPGVSLGDAAKIIERTMHDIGVPKSVLGEPAGNAQLFKKSLTTLPLLLLTAILTVYIVLGMLYESLIHPITILSTLPTAGIGALMTMMATGTELSVVSIIGIILLIGIVKKNAIMMIDFALVAEREHGKSPREAIHEACLIRFRPIMMTTLAALFGALPLALGHGTGSELRQPLGIAVIGGLIVSQILTLYTTPVIYCAISDAKAWVMGLRRPSRAQRA